MYIIFDIGGTHMRFATSEDGEEFSHVVSIATPGIFADGREAIEQVAESLGLEDPTHAIGGIAGIVDDGKLSYAPNLEEWAGVDIAGELKEIFGVETSVYNDALLGGLGEAIHGAGKGKDIVAYITVGTGIGGARIVDGAPDEYAEGFEPGHQIVDYEELLSLEELVSGTAIEKRLDTDAEHVDEPSVWGSLGKTLGVGIYNSVLHWSPDIVVVGGSVALKAPDIFFDTARETYVGLMNRSGRKAVPITPGKLDDSPVLYGALEMLKLDGVV
ncbi:MAG: ROK family protein [Candidatus Paceibacterota bacterium]